MFTRQTLLSIALAGLLVVSIIASLFLYTQNMKLTQAVQESETKLSEQDKRGAALVEARANETQSTYEALVFQPERTD